MSVDVLPSASASSFSIGTVVQKTFAVFGGAFVPLIVLLGILELPQFLVTLLGAGPAVIGIVSIVEVVLGLIGQGIIVYGVCRALQGHGFDLASSSNVALRRIGALVGLALVVGLATGLATMLFVIPGIIVALMFFVAVPVCLMENRGVLDSMSRSRELTKGYRWSLFGILVLFALMVIGGSLIIGYALGALAGTIGAAVAGFVVQVVVGAFQGTLVAVLYSELRKAKEGVSIDQIVDVFS